MEDGGRVKNCPFVTASATLTRLAVERHPGWAHMAPTVFVVTGLAREPTSSFEAANPQ